jgi:transcriptional regulator with XRE-family HTH domain
MDTINSAETTPSRPTPGAWLTRQMEARRLSVRQLADALAVTTQTIYDWRGDRAAISEERVPRLAAVLGVSEIEARRGLGYWVPEGALPSPAELDRGQLREALRRFRQAADDLERLIEDPPE